MWPCLSILLFLFAGVYAKEVAVLIGGWNNENRTHWIPVDIYDTHLEDSEKYCKDGNKPTIPNLPWGTTGHTGIFLPNYGIYLCGWYGDTKQERSECWNYNPQIKRYL